MALARISGRFRAPTDRAGRRRRSRSHGDGPDERAPQDPALVRERRRRNVSIGIGVLLVAVVLGVVTFGYYWEFYRPPRVWAGSVNQVEFTMGDLVQRIRVLQGINRYSQGGRVDLSTVPFEYLQNLIHAEVLRQRAPSLGIQPTDEAVTRALRAQFQPVPPPGQETNPGQLDQEFNNNYQTFLTATGLSDSEYRTIVEEDLTRFGLGGLLAQDIVSPQEQVEVQWIHLPLDPGSQAGIALQPVEVVRRIEAEDFRTVALEVSSSDGYADSSGYVGWVPRGAFPDLDPILYGDEERGTEALEPGETSRPLYTPEEGIYIVNVLSAPSVQELSDIMRVKLNVEMVEEWQGLQLQLGAEDGTVLMHFDSDLYAWVADQVGLTSPRVAAQGP
jgi:hypothetical protein